jgi:hypothetical protein
MAENMNQDSTSQGEKMQTKNEAGIEPRLKIDELIGIMSQIADSEGYFDPKDLLDKVRRTDLSKSASLILSHLRHHGAVKDDKLKIPVSEGQEGIKAYINLASKLHRQKCNIARSKAAVKLAPPRAKPEPRTKAKPEPAAPQPAVKTKAEDVPVPTISERDFRALYEESQANALKLDAELSVYKEICFHLMDTLKK